ncbi:MAG: serine/threonine protein kinase [Myxococcales bacterium]|nr:serine/threonine protein kinase [Myxococcales bacterium]
MSDRYPKTFGHYTLLEPLAKGGMGSLYLACRGEAGMEKLCVVKTVLRELADKEYLQRFRDEAKVVVRLAHGNLVPVFDAGNVAGELYIAMEHIDGKDLRAVWNRCAKKQIAFPVDVACHLVKELLRGLQHAHTCRDLELVHRDVSPPNVLLAFSGEVKLTDFGLASSTLKLERTAPGVIYGKVSYMSPEHARGEPLDGRTDQYAAGVILWELLTGRQLVPSGDGDALERARNPRVAPPSSRASRVGRALDTIVMRALAPDRDDRFADCETFRAALAEHLAREAPATDAARVAAFLRELFDEEIEADRTRRDRLVAGTRRGAIPEAQAMSEQEAGDDIDLHSSAGILGTLVEGRYQVSRLIGEGGMGRVYEAEHVQIGKRVAMKVLHPSYTRSADAVQRFRREARAAASLGHPNIVDVTDSGTTPDGAVYFVMEYLEGGDLADLIGKEGRQPIERAIHLGVQIARALHAAHAAGIVHRDLKPENIFLVERAGERDVVKVLDFGVARNVEHDGKKQRRLTNPGMTMGTPEYMAPEQAAGQPADARSDVYAAGAILYEMLSGDPPHTGANYMEVLSKKASQVPDPIENRRPEVSRALAKLVMAALAKEPEARPQTMEELARALEQCRPDRRASRAAPVVVVPPVASPPRSAESAESAPSPLAPVVGEESAGSLRRRTRRRMIRIALPVAVALVAAASALAIYRASAAPESTPKSDSPTGKADPPPSSPLDRARRDRRGVAPSTVPVPASDGAASAQSGLARAAYERGHYVDAVRLGERAVQQGGGPAAHLILGDAYFKLLRYSEAAREYRAILEGQPGSVEAQRRLEAAERKARG